MQLCCKDIEKAKLLVQDAVAHYHVQSEDMCKIYEKACWGPFWQIS